MAAHDIAKVAAGGRAEVAHDIFKELACLVRLATVFKDESLGKASGE